MAWILLLVVLFTVWSYQPMREHFAKEDIFFKQYMLELEGMYSEEKELWLKREREHFEEFTEQMREAVAANPQAADIIDRKYRAEMQKYRALEQVEAHAAYDKLKRRIRRF